MSCCVRRWNCSVAATMAQMQRGSSSLQISTARPCMSDRPDITTATRRALTQRGEYAVDPRAPVTPNSPPNFQVMNYEIRRSGSEAAAFGEPVQ